MVCRKVGAKLGLNSYTVDRVEAAGLEGRVRTSSSDIVTALLMNRKTVSSEPI